MQNPDDVVSPFVWLDGDGFWNDLLAVVFSGSTWPEGSESAVRELAEEWSGLAQGLADAADTLQTAAVDLLAAWDAPASGTFDDLARSLLGSPDVGLPGHVQNAAAVAGQVAGFGVDLQYAKVSVNIAVAVAAAAVVIALVMAPVGGLSLTTLGPAAQLGRQAVLRALEQLATAAGRRAVVRDMGRAVADAALTGVGRGAGHSATHHLAHEAVEEVLEELVVDVGTQTYQVSDGTRPDWNGLSTVMAAVGGGVGGAVGAGAVAPVFTRLRSTRRFTAIAGLGADGRFLARSGNVGLRLTGGLAATASTNAVASPVGGVAASLLTGQGFPALDASTFGMAAMAALGRYGTVSPTNPAVLTAAVHPAQTLARVHVDALAGHTLQQALRPAADPVEGKALRGTAAHAVPDRASTGTPPAPVRTTVPPAGGGPQVAAPGPAGTPSATALSATVTVGPTSGGSPAGPTSLGTQAATPAGTTPSDVGPLDVGPSDIRPTDLRPTDLRPTDVRPTDPAPLQSSTPQSVHADQPGPPATTTNGSSPPRGAGPASSDTSSPDLADRAGGAPGGSTPASPPASAERPTAPGWVAADPAPPPGPAAAVAGGASAGDAAAEVVGNGRGPEAAVGQDGGQPPGGPPSAEQALYDGMPEALRRYLVEAVAHGQVWADLVQDQLVEVVGHLAAQGLPVAEAVGLANAVKSLQSAARKIQPSIQGGSTFASTIWSMDDLVRFSLQIEPERYGESVLEALAVFRTLGWSVPAVPAPGQQHDDWRNTWAIGNRHHGLLVVMTHAVTGQRVEMQFPTPQSWTVGKQTHELYETMRFPKGDPFDRVVALGRILDIVRREAVEDRFPLGLDLLGPAKPNGPERIFAKEPQLAIKFRGLTHRKYGSPLNALLHAKITPASAGLIVAALNSESAQAPSVEGEVSDDGPQPPRMAAMGEGEGEGSGQLGEVPGDRSDSRAIDGPVHRAPGGPGTGTTGSAGAIRGPGARRGEGLRLPDRDLAKARDEADPGQPLGGGRGTGDDPVRRPEWHLDLGPDERQRDRAPGGRGPVRPAGAGDPGGSGRTGPAEGDDAAHPGTTPGDVPQPGRPRARHVGDPGRPAEAPRPARLNGPLAVGADAALALEHVLAESRADVLWEGLEGTLPGRVLLLADGSTVRVSTGPNPWARTDPDRPLQMWTVGAFHLDDGPLTPAASAFLGDLVTALTRPGGGGPSSHWLAQRATLDARTHRITEPGVARPIAAGSAVLVWDAAQGWVEAPRAGGLARVVDEGLVAASLFTHRADVVEGAAHVLELIQRTEAADHHETRARRRAELRWAGEEWVATAVAPTLAEHLGQAVRVLAGSEDRQLVELADGRLAVVTVAGAENDALSGSRPGLQQAGTTADIGQLRNELADRGGHGREVLQLTRQLQLGVVRHFRVQGVLSADGFVGMRVTEFEVTRPAHDAPGVLRTRVEPHRHVDPGLSAREAMRRAVAGWTPTSVTEAITNALRWLPFVNPHHDRYPVTARMPWSNNCGDCSRAVADLLHGRDARAAFGDNGARVLDDHRFWGTKPGELDEMWRWAGVRPGWRAWDHEAPVFSPQFTASANERIGRALQVLPEGTVAIVLVNWADEQGRPTGGHWFNAAVTEHGVEWLDGQTAGHGAWPPPVTRPYAGFAVITRAAGTAPWVDLGQQNP
ncbi:Papain fold toxin 1, glutamine deamidase [Klenkia soli]|uniref:Papain fold toxin 1, glutamine deamidase n=1 Tax=Klenkia soli TaxID=1052260 RepID=A0A1H0NZ10_9ACTN|nr:toxin glutamine deamidase domain-containing protein [Klenkia soli]SDO97883.1 Papain fold toxin 1, glutamine deamidase [Klenkia soli]